MKKVLIFYTCSPYLTETLKSTNVELFSTITDNTRPLTLGENTNNKLFIEQKNNKTSNNIIKQQVLDTLENKTSSATSSPTIDTHKIIEFSKKISSIATYDLKDKPTQLKQFNQENLYQKKYKFSTQRTAYE